MGKRLRLWRNVVPILFCFAAPAFSYQVPKFYQVYPVSYLSTVPMIDGRITDDPVWENVLQEKDFVNLSMKQRSLKKTSFSIAYSQDSLYLGVICNEPDMDKIKADMKDTDPLWSEDGIEIFLLPAGAKCYFQFIVSASGARFNSRDTGESLPIWNWHARTLKGKDFYSVEVEIPFEVLGKKKSGKEEPWSLNLCRNALTPGADRFTTWSHLRSTFAEPENFGKIIFTGLSLDENEAEKMLLRDLWKQNETLIRHYENSCEKRNHILSKKTKGLLEEMGWHEIEKQMTVIESLNPEERCELKEKIKQFLLSFPSQFDKMEIECIKEKLFEE